MVAPLEPPRNAEGARSEGRVVCGNGYSDQRGQQYKHYKDRDTPKDTSRSGRGPIRT
jgi:hypothetical protein